MWKFNPFTGELDYYTAGGVGATGATGATGTTVPNIGGGEPDTIFPVPESLIIGGSPTSTY